TTLPEGCGFAIQFHISRTIQVSFSYWFSTHEAVNAIPLAALSDAISKHSIPTGWVHCDYIEFQLLFSCWGFKWNVAGPGPAPAYTYVRAQDVAKYGLSSLFPIEAGSFSLAKIGGTKADINAVNRDDRTPLHNVVDAGSQETVQTKLDDT